MQQNAPFCVLPTAFSLSRFGMYGTKYVYLKVMLIFVISLTYICSVFDNMRRIKLLTFLSVIN